MSDHATYREQLHAEADFAPSKPGSRLSARVAPLD